MVQRFKSQEKGLSRERRVRRKRSQEKGAPRETDVERRAAKRKGKGSSRARERLGLLLPRPRGGRHVDSSQRVSKRK